MGGVIGITMPVIGLPSATQLVGIEAAVVGGGGGVLCLIVANSSDKTPAERYEALDG